MKNYILFIILCLAATPLVAQNQETLISGNIKSGGFGAPVVKLSVVNGKSSVLTGARGGWIIKFPSNNCFVLGGGGYGLATDVRLSILTGSGVQPLYLSLGYGGLELEYVHASDKLVHFSVQTLIGAGGVTYSKRNHEHLSGYPDSSFFVLEPTANIIVNVTHFFRIGTGIGYRFVNGVHLAGTSDRQLSDISGSLTLKFGKF